MRIYNKLVRDHIPEIINKNGQTPYISVLDDEQYAIELKKKLCEEVQEYIESEEAEELADIMEVLEALAICKGFSLDDIIQIKNKKAAENGRFDKKLFLEKVED